MRGFRGVRGIVRGGRAWIAVVGALSVALSAAVAPATGAAGAVPLARPTSVNGHAPVTPASGNDSEPSNLVAHDGQVWFSANTPSTAEAIWASDGSSSGLTAPVYGNFPDVRALAWAGNQLFFIAGKVSDGRDELWVGNGTGIDTPTSFDVAGASGYFLYNELDAVGNRVFFSVCDATYGCEPWVSDGSGPGTHRLKDINPGPGGSFASGFFAFGSSVLFTADDGLHRMEPVDLQQRRTPGC